jgi:hypothetical protein
MLITVAAGPIRYDSFTRGSVNHTFSYKFTLTDTFYNNATITDTTVIIPIVKANAASALSFIAAKSSSLIIVNLSVYGVPSSVSLSLISQRVL